MAIVNRHIATNDPYVGLGPNVLNVPMLWAGYPAAAASNNVASKTQRTQGSSMAPGTQIDYPRNVVVYITPSVSSAGVTGGGVTVFGRDAYGSYRSETFNSLAATSSVGQSGSVNFAKVDTVSMLLSIHSDTSSAASAYAVYVGGGNKLGLPVALYSTNAVLQIHQGTTEQLVYSGSAHSSASSNNQWTVVTGDYWVGGVKLSNAHNSGSLLHIRYMANGRLAGANYVP